MEESDNGDESVLLLNHHYQLGELIEKGPLSIVRRGIHRSTARPCAVKSINLDRFTAASGLSREAVDREMELSALLKHPHLCELRDVIAGDRQVHLVFEALDGNDICFEIVRRASSGFVYSEAVISHYMKQLLQAIAYMHSLGIVHRDIRPHNIVLARDNSAPLKLTGFGVAARLSMPDSMEMLGRVGTPQFMAPEVASDRPYGTKADLWSTGVVLFLLLSGRLPINGSKQYIYECAIEGRYSHHGGAWTVISNGAQDLLTRLLTVDPAQRWSAEEALNHAWIRDKDTAVPRRHLQETVEQTRRYNQRRRIKVSNPGHVP